MEIKNFITDNEQMNVTVTDGVQYSLRTVINDAYRTFNGKFENPKDNNFEKIFYRMIWVIYRTIIMSSDVDLKDVNIRSLNGQGLKSLALLKLGVRSHLMRTGFGKLIDSIMESIVWFGSAITKRVDGKVYLVDLRNYITEASIKNPQERSHAELCQYTYDEMLSYKDDWKEHWQEIETLWEQMKHIGKFNIVEFWTFGEVDGKIHKVCEKYLDKTIKREGQKKDIYNVDPFLMLDRFITPYKKKRDSERLIETLGEYEEMFPYDQADFFDVPGRWLSFGCSELLAGVQEHYNEQFNLKRKKDILDLRGIFIHKYTTASNSLSQDFLNNLETGDVLSMDTDEDLQRLIIDTKTGEFIANIDKLYEVMRLILGVTSQGTGEELPGSTSASGVKANFATQQTTYDYVRERMHHFLQRLFMNGYFEDILDEMTVDKMIAFTGSPREIEELDRTLIDKAVNQKTQERYAAIEQMKSTEDDNGNQVPGDVSWDEVQMLDDLENAERKTLMEDFKTMGDKRWAELKKDMYESLQYVVEFYVNSETFDKTTKLEAYRNMLNDPNYQGSRKAVEDAIMDILNENPRQFDKTPEEKAQEVEAAKQKMMLESGNMSAMAPNPMTDTVQ